jgi:hypothetical protein
MKKIILILLLLLSSFVTAQMPSGNVLYLDGQSDFVQLFEPIIKDLPFTIEVWAKTFGQGGGQYKQNPVFEQRSLATVINASAAVMTCGNGRGSITWTVRDYEHHLDQVKTDIFPHNEWHHVAGVVSQEAMYLYIDGELVHTVTHSQVGPFDTEYDHVAIGRHAYSSIVAGYFYGYLDELRIWNAARTQEDIQQNMHNPLELDTPEARRDLAAYWDFEHSFDVVKNGFHWNSIEDMSGHQHHGALMGDAQLVPIDPPYTALSGFSLQVPLDGSTVQTTCPQLEWQPATQSAAPSPESIVYEVYLDTNPEFPNDVMHTVRGKKRELQLCNLEPGQKYYWKIKAINRSRESVWSTEIYSFSISQSGHQIAILNDFSLISPGFDATVKTTRPTVYWESATNSPILNSDDLLYEVHYSEFPDFGSAHVAFTMGDITWTTLSGLKPGTTYFWKVLAKNRQNDQKWSMNYSAMFISHTASQIEDIANVPEGFRLSQNYPNPFNPTTSIQFELPRDGQVELLVFNLFSEKVKALAEGFFSSGAHTVTWDGRDDLGEKSPSGIYVYRLRYLDSGRVQVQSKKMLMVK